jgi:ABC-type multidrug transport system fused ATPase/permease subunit
VIIFREALGEPSIAALSLTYVVQTTSLFQWGFRMWAEVQNNFVSVERALSYTKLPQEAAATEPTDAALIQRGWPEAAAVRFAEVRMRYRPGLPLALDGADFAFTGGIKAAVVGRSGAGETSL